MLTASPRLRIRRPSPTTVEFTVTTLPRQTLTFTLLRTILLVVRVALGLSILAVSYARLSHSISTYAPSSATTTATSSPSLEGTEEQEGGGGGGGRRDGYGTLRVILWAMHSVLQRFYTYTSLGVALRGLALATPVVVLAPATVLLAYAVVLRVHTSESLLVLRGLGVQTSCSPPTYLGGSSGATRFIPTEKIRDILVNEAFRGFEVRYYLVVIVEDEPDVVVVFPRLLPPRAIVETVWRAARECLYEPAKG